MKKFWYRASKWNKACVAAAIESGFEALYVNAEDVEKARSLSRIPLIATKGGDMTIGTDVFEVLIDAKEKENDAVARGGTHPVIIYNKDWTIIPLENLISKTKNLIQHVRTYDEAVTALETLERGADGILLETDAADVIKKIGSLIAQADNERVALTEAEIVSVEPVGMGDRVVVDTCSILKPGHGLLVGDSSSAFFLVHNENVESPYADPRPFRVNAGAVHAYVRMPGDETKYLAELASGSRVLVVDPEGNTAPAVVGRAKMETRPLMKITARCGGRTITLVMQNAETIRLTAKDGAPRSITTLKAGDTVLAHVAEHAGGRHFGKKIEETIREL